MSFRPDHELHRRRMGRNVGLGVVLLVFALLVYGLSVVKAGQNGVPGLSAGRAQVQEAGQ